MCDFGLLFVLLHFNCQETPIDSCSKKLESAESQEVSSTQSHSFTLKKKNRTSEEGSKAIYRRALIAAIGSRGSRPSNTSRGDTKISLPTESSSVKIEEPSLETIDRTYICCSLKPENTSVDSDTFQVDQWFSPQVFVDEAAQEDNIVPKASARVSPM